MSASINKRLSPVIILAVTALMVGMCFFLLSCAPTQSAVEVEPEGALSIPSREGETRLRAYRPEVELTLTWEDRESGSAAVVVENIAAEFTEVKVTPAAGQQEASCTVEKVSPTVLKLIVKGSGTQRLELTPSAADGDSPLQFAAVGDCQGRIDVLSKIIDEVNSSDVDFLICLGDLVASGSDDEYKAFQEAMAALNCPYYTIPGNHDVKGDGIEYYCRNFSPEYYSFDYRGIQFILLDSTSMGMDDEQLAWLQEKLDEGEQPAYLFLHVPPVDPRGSDHAFLDADQAQAFIELVSAPASSVEAIFSGHIHMFYQGQINGVDFVVSGGGGASLYASAEQGGYYHFTLCRVAGDGLQLEPVKIEAPPHSDELVVNGKEGDIILSQEELDGMAVLEGELSFENQFDNFKGKGAYRGVPIRDLVEKVGGMEPDDNLMVYALDGYSQEFAYENVYPDSCGWRERQGEMALAVEYNGTTVPEWPDGYRIAFFPEDGVYDNEDCSLTSAEDQGWNLYQSAGGRWVRNVIRLEVVPCQNQE
jgi:predicted phosphodiesterase